MPNTYSDPFQKVMGQAIELTMRKRALDQNQAQFDQNIMAQAAQGKLDLEERKAELATDVEKLKIGFASDAGMEALKRGDTNFMNAIRPQMEALGLLVPKDAKGSAIAMGPEQERLYDTEKGLQPRVDAIGKHGPGGKGGKGSGGGGKPSEFDKAYYDYRARHPKEDISRTDYRRKHYLTNPAIQQELISNRQEKRHLNRQNVMLKRTISKVKGIYKGSEMHEAAAADAREQLVLNNMELDELKTREDELLDKKTDKVMAKRPPASQHKGEYLENIETGELEKSDGKNWIVQ